MPVDYTKGSAQSKNERTKLTKAVNGTVMVTKKSAGRKMLETFLEEDLSEVKRHLIKDWAIPAAKNLIFEGVKTFLYSGTPVKSNIQQVSYTNYSKPGAVNRSSGSANAERPNLENIRLSNKADAEAVLSQLTAQIERFGDCTVGDLYDVIGEECPYTWEHYGWTTLAGSYTRRDGDSVRLILPKPVYLD